MVDVYMYVPTKKGGFMNDDKYDKRKINTNIGLEFRIVKHLDILSKKLDKTKASIVNDILIKEFKLDLIDDKN